MLAGELAVHFRLLQLQFGDAGVQGDDLVEDGLGFQADIHRLAAGLESIQGILGLFKVATHLWQLAAEEFQAGCGFRRGALDVLTYVEFADFVEYLDGAGRVVVLQRHGNDPGFLAALGDVKVFLVVEDGGHAALAHHLEFGAGVGLQGFDLDLHAVLLVRPANFALH
ncbi:hypothetical protein D3C78_812340 [compost metagenome]